MNFLKLENISKSFGDKILLDNVNFSIEKGEKIAIIAKNGSGKSTMLKIVVGEEAPEGENASYMVRKGIKLSYLPQEPDFLPEQTVTEAIFEANNELLNAVKEYELAMIHPENETRLNAALEEMDRLKAWDFESKVKETLFKFKITDLEQTVGTLSGGQRKRLALAKLIIEQAEFLILDEPTNHLDIDMIEWLEEYLSQPNITLLMVTHDRYFLERVCNRMVELDRGQIYKYTGNYSDFLEKKTMRHEVESVELEKAQKLFKKELNWIRRMPQARATKAKSRVDAFDEIKEKAHRKLDNGKIQMEFKTARLGSKILEAEYISKSFGDIKIVDNFFYKFRKGDRVGIVGPNGVGKSTFLQLITKQLRPDSGKVNVGGTVVFGFYTQEGLDLSKDKRVIDVIRDIAEYIPMQGYKLTAIQLLDRFLFTREQHQVFASQLSGGERRRLYLLTVLMQNPNFLILDEPTNDLDIITLNILEEFLLDFPGCLVIVTHDRYFMDKLVEHLFVFYGDGQIKDFNGDYTEYRKWILEHERAQRRSEKAALEKSRPIESDAEAPARKLSYQERKEMGKIEKDLKKMEARKAEIFELFNDSSLSSEDIEKLSIETGEIDKKMAEMEERWMELAEFA